MIGLEASACQTGYQLLAMYIFPLHFHTDEVRGLPERGMAILPNCGVIYITAAFPMSIHRLTERGFAKLWPCQHMARPGSGMALLSLAAHLDL